MYLILNHNQIKAVLQNADQVVAALTNIKNSFRDQFLTSTAYAQRHYICAENYAANHMKWIKVVYVQNDNALYNVDWLPFYGRDNTYNQSGWIETPRGIIDATGSFLLVEQAQYEATSKVFATVTKRGIKSFGMDVILDPSMHSDELRSVEYYQELVGTFARVKASANIHDYGPATLFFAPESLGNIRVETQVIDGSLATIL